MNRLAAAAASIVLVTTAVFALAPTPKAEAGNSYFKIHCRGPFLLMHSPTGNPQVAGKKSPTKAGQHGKLLAEGTCAWQDRALNDNEQANISVAGSDTSHAFLAPMLAACSLDEDCVLALMARSQASGVLTTHAAQTAAIRPYEGSVGKKKRVR